MIEKNVIRYYRDFPSFFEGKIVLFVGRVDEVVDDSCGLKIPIITSRDIVEIDIFILARKILCLLEITKEAKRLGRNDRKRYVERFSSQVIRSNMLALYQSLFQIPTDE